MNRLAILITVLAFGIILVGCGGSETSETEKKSTAAVTPNANTSATVNVPVSNAAPTAANMAAAKTVNKDTDDTRRTNTAANNTNKHRDTDDKSGTDKDRDKDRDADDQ